MAPPSAPALGVLPEDRFLWQFWVNKGMDPRALAEKLAGLGEATNWDYIAGNSLYGGFEGEVLRCLSGQGAAPAEFLSRFARDVRGHPHRIAPGGSESDLLVLCASPRMTAEEEVKAAALCDGAVAWEALVAAAARANLTVAVHHNLSRLDRGSAAPAEVWSVLGARAEGVAGRNRRLLDLQDDVFRLLTGEGIRILLLKESGLALSHYGNGRLRMMGDLDLLLGPSDLERVVGLLESRGYQSAEVLWTKEHYRRQHHHAAPLVQADLAAKIEPHHSIALQVLPGGEPPGLVAAMAERAVRIDARAWCFTPADILFHLSVDLFSNAFIGKMGQLCDARELVRQGGVEWPLLERTARAAGAEAHVAFCLRLLSDIGTPVPAEVVQALEPGSRPPFDARGLRRMAERNLFGYVRSRARLSRAGEKLMFQALTRPGGWLGRTVFLAKRYLYVGASDEGVGELGRRSRPSTGQALGRMMTLPLRAVRRWTASRRMP